MPLARYDTRYARALGKWMLNLANAARLFYPGELPPGHGSSEFWTGDPRHVIAYEGLRYAWQGKSPCATGDPVALQWGPKTDLGLYGSSYAGLLGALVQTTSDPQILQLDCLATDFFRARRCRRTSATIPIPTDVNSRSRWARPSPTSTTPRSTHWWPAKCPARRSSPCHRIQPPSS